MTDLATTVTVIDACGRAHVPALLMSDPGVGKSSLVRGIAALDGVPCETVLGSIREPADIAGLPVVGDDGQVRLAPPAWAKRLQAEGAGYLMLDEITTTPPSTQAALLTVALERVVGETPLPDGVRVIAGANPPDRAADGYDLAPPLANRFCHLNFAPTVEDFLDGAAVGWSAPPSSRAVSADESRTEAVKAQVLGFIRTRPNLLHDFPRDAASTGGPWPSRRSWSMLMAALAHVRDDDTAARQSLTFGLVGEGAGVEFLTWCEQNDLPDPSDVVDDPSVMDWTERPDRVWAVLTGVVALAASRGSQAAWVAAWGPLVAAAEAGAADVAAAAARPLGRARPAKARIPAKVRDAFGPALVAAGISAEKGGEAA